MIECVLSRRVRYQRIINLRQPPQRLVSPPLKFLNHQRIHSDLSDNLRMDRRLAMSTSYSSHPTTCSCEPLVNVAMLLSEPGLPLITAIYRVLNSTVALVIRGDRPDPVGILLPLHDNHAKAPRGVNCDVTMHKPSSRIVGLECYDNVSVCR